MNHFLLPANLGQTIIDYLALRPCGEVMAMVQAMQQLQLAPPAKPRKKAADLTDPPSTV